jgi:hypothetical protein
MSSDEILLTDRTTTEIDDKCGQKRWWYKQHDGTGIVPAAEASYFQDGRDIHADLAAINAGTPWEKVADGLEEVAPAASDPMPLRERWLRRLGWITAYGRYLFPTLQAKYETIAVEQEMVLTRGNLWIAFTADWIARSKETKRPVVFDFKSVGMLTKNWAQHWPYAIQMHINIKGVEEELGEEVDYAQIIGIRKGDEDQGKLRHPYTWAYSNGGDTPGDWSDSWRKGWILRSVAEYPGGPDAWIERCGPEVGLAQFPFSLPIHYDDIQFKRFIRERFAREQEVKHVEKLCQEDESSRDIFFPHRTNECRPVIGPPCAYLAACTNATVGADPVGSGLYVPRTPHHEIEIIGVDDE